jgi:uncharacterized protein (DUF433 family)
MSDEEILARVAVDPNVCGGRPFIRGTRVCITVILDALSRGLGPEEIIEHYPMLDRDDLQAALAYASRLAEQNGGLAILGGSFPLNPFRPL